MTERIIELSESIDTAEFYGVNNANILLLRNLNPNIHLVARGHLLKVSGEGGAVDDFERSIRKVEEFCDNFGAITTSQIISLLKGEQMQRADDKALILHGVNGKPIMARSKNQLRLVHEFEHNDMLFATGPAGSGKTYTAIALAVKALKNKSVKRIILSRPAVEAGEKLGFLPGDMREKVDPYLQPLYDALQDMIPGAKLQDYMSNGTIQIAPLAFMRGRTLADAVIILDEAQNTTTAQIKMFLTRLGLNAKMIITGDLTQIDLPRNQVSGLRHAIGILHGIKGISFINFEQSDIVRHSLVQRIVDAYQASQEKNALQQAVPENADGQRVGALSAYSLSVADNFTAND